MSNFYFYKIKMDRSGMRGASHLGFIKGADIIILKQVNTTT